MASRPSRVEGQRSSNLALRTLAGFVALALLMAVALFGAAGTLAYWQAWLYLLVFFGSVAGITLYLWQADPRLLERRVAGGPLAEREATQRVIQSVAALAFLALFVVPGLDHRFSWSTVPAAASGFADALVVVGFWIIFLVFRVNTFTAATIGVAEEQRVVSTGPYAVVRHPMYAGALLMLLATPIGLDSWWGTIAFAALLAVIVWRLQEEEQFLMRNLNGYPEYRARVRRRLIPFIW
jgi:protein-S-isoprenylcysteine O-methyltransferase Ste14